MTTIWWALAALALILAVRALAERLRLPAAVLLVLAGLAVAVLPVPTATLHPELILHGVIPPLLFVAARDASLIELRGNLRLIGSLSVALVAVTALVTGAGLVLVVGGLGLAAAVAIGAAMAPPDPVAALAIGRRAGLPRRLTTVIEGEGLLNDATALTIYGLAVTAAVGGGFSVGEGIGRFLLAVAGGVVVGLLVARLASVLERVDDDLVVNAVSLATPFLAFAAAEPIHGSGVLAVVIAGLVLGHRRVQGARGAARLQTAAVWRIVEYLLEGYVFLLIGEQVPALVEGLAEYDTGTVVAAAGTAVAAVLLVRPLWLLLVGRLSGMVAIESRRDVVALSWAGTRVEGGGARAAAPRAARGAARGADPPPRRRSAVRPRPADPRPPTRPAGAARRLVSVPPSRGRRRASPPRRGGTAGPVRRRSCCPPGPAASSPPAP